MDGRRAATSSTWAKALHAGRPIAPPRVGYSAGKAVSEKRASSPAEQALRALASSAGGIAWLAKSLDQRSPSAPGHAPFASHADVSGLRSCFSPASAQYAQARRSPDAGSTAGERSRPQIPTKVGVLAFHPFPPQRKHQLQCNCILLAAYSRRYARERTFRCTDSSRPSTACSRRKSGPISD